MRLNHAYFIIGVFVWILGFQCSVAGESNRDGVLRGKVLQNSTNEPIPSAFVFIQNSSFGTSTDENGQFTLRGIPPGSYGIRVSAIGYATAIRRTVLISPGETTEMVVSLQERQIQVGEMQVNDSYFSAIPNCPISTQRFSHQEIDHAAGSFDDVVRAMMVLPGIAQIRPYRNDLIVRGGSPAENLTLIDGIETSMINHFGALGFGGGNSSIINTDLVQDVSFSRGGFGVRYGDKLSSVLALDLREEANPHHECKGSLAATEFGVTADGPVAKDVNYFFSIRRGYLDLLFRLYNISFAPEFWDYTAKVIFKAGQNDKISIIGFGAIDYTHLFNENDTYRENNSNLMFSNQNNFAGGIIWKHFFTNGLLDITLRHTSDRYHFFQNDLLGEPIFQCNSTERETSLRSDLTLFITPSTELSVGGEGKLISLRNDLDLKKIHTFFNEFISAQTLSDTTTTKTSLYAQLSRTISIVKISIGIRGDYFDLLSHRVAVAPRLSLTCAVAPLTTIRMSIGKYFQDPSYIWIVSNSYNRNLSPIGSNQILFGIDHDVRPDVRCSIETYGKFYTNYPASLTRRYLVMTNAGVSSGGLSDGFVQFGFDSLVSRATGFARGIEVLVQKKLSESPYFGTLSFSYSKAEVTALDGKTRPQDFDQRWIINVAGGYIFGGDWEGTLRFLFATGRPYTPTTVTENQTATSVKYSDGDNIQYSAPYSTCASRSADAYNSVRLRAFHNLDIRISRRWPLGTCRLTTYLDIHNVYNFKADDIPNHYNPATNKYEEPPGVGIVPSLGINIEL